MPTYDALSQKTERFLAMTGYSVKEFDNLLPAFQPAFDEFMESHTVEGTLRRGRRHSSYRNSPLATVADKLLFILVYLKQATTQEVHATLLGMYLYSLPLSW